MKSFIGLILVFATVATAFKLNAASSRFGQRIEGGTTCEEVVPYLAGISLNTGSWCGGALISANWVLTVAQCTYGAKTAKIYLGTLTAGTGGVTRDVLERDILTHHDFDWKTFANDIALIWIHEVELSKDIQIIPLPKMADKDKSYLNQLSMITGYGQPIGNFDYKAPPKYGYLNVIGNAECEKYYPGLVTQSKFCGSNSKGPATCRGDAGSPLYVVNEELLIGTVSYISDEACKNSFPTLFTKINHYLYWIWQRSGVKYE